MLYDRRNKEIKKGEIIDKIFVLSGIITEKLLTFELQ